METTWSLLLILLTFTGFVTLQETAPPKVSVLQGHTAELPCKSDFSGTQCEWTRADSAGTSELIASAAGVSIEEFPQVRGELNNNPQNGICALTLHNIPWEAAGDYTCRIKGGPRFVMKVTLEVGTVPSMPRIYYNDQPIDDGIPHELNEGENRIMCKVENGIPLPKLTWSDDLNGEAEEQGGSVTNTLTLSAENFRSAVPEKTLNCIAIQNHYKDNTAIATATVGFPYAPTIVQTQLADGSQSADKGPQGVTLYCSANGIPPPEYEWRSKKKDENGVELELPVSSQQNFTAMESAVYHCYARNTKSINWTQSSGSITINGIRAVISDPVEAQDAGVIIGIVVAAIVLIVLIVAISLLTYRRKALCFKESSRDPPAVNQSSSENGTSHLPLSNPEYNDKDEKADQNENKQKELVYAQLDLTQSQGNNPKPPKPAEEKTEYAQIKFQPKENQV